jgi:hypothetical protein
LDNFEKNIGHDLPTQAKLPTTITVLAGSGEEKLYFVGEGLYSRAVLKAGIKGRPLVPVVNKGRD